MTRILVTGGTGFVGRATVAALLRTGVEVHLTARTPPTDGFASAATYHKADLLAGETDRLVKRLRPTHLVHLAWIATPGVHAVSPKNADWLAASTRLASVFVDRGGRRFVAAGTYAEYAPSTFPCRENHPTIAATPYVAAKLAFRQSLHSLAETTELDVVWARLTSIYGPHEDSRRVVAAAMCDLAAGRTAEFGDGAGVRDFQHIDDAGAALAELTLSQWAGTVNVSSDERHSIRSVVERIARLAGAEDRVRFGVRPPNPFDPPYLGADGGLLRRVVDWRPRHGFDESLARAFEWWKTQVQRRAA